MSYGRIREQGYTEFTATLLDSLSEEDVVGTHYHRRTVKLGRVNRKNSTRLSCTTAWTIM